MPSATSTIFAPSSPSFESIERHHSALKERVFTVLAFVITIAFFLFLHSYLQFGPGQPGIDENAYLVGGKFFSQSLTTGIKPSEPYAYIGPMWVRTDDGWFYPKYPVGVPFLNAIAIWLAGGHRYEAAYYTSPVCATFAVLAMYFLTRRVTGSAFAGILATLLLATNPTFTHLAMVPSSHAPAIGFSLWGMVALVSWWKTDRLWVGVAAGLLLGFTVTLRYTEGLLVLPMIGVALMNLRWREARSYLRTLMPFVAWAIPVAALVLFNRATIGHITGYDSSNESTGFTVAEFQDKWEYTLQQLNMYGMFFILPLGVLGMLLMLLGRASWRMGLVMVLWFVPGAVLYTAYYWGQQAPGVGFLRFFLTLYPPVIASATWLCVTAAKGLTPARPLSPLAASQTSHAAALGVGAFIGAIALAGLYVSLPQLERQQVHNANLASASEAFLAAVPAARGVDDNAPLVFADSGGGMFSRTIMHFQFIGDGEWYSTEAFNQRGAGRGFFGGRGGGGGRGGQPNDPDADADPTPMQRERQEFMRNLYAKLSADDLQREQARVINDALAKDRKVFAVLGAQSADAFKQRLSNSGFTCTLLATGSEPLSANAGGANFGGGGGGRGRFGGGFGGGNFGPGGGGGGPGQGQPPGPGGGGGGGRGGRGGFGFDRGNTGGLAPPNLGNFRFGGGDASRVFQIVQISPNPTTRPTSPSSAPADAPTTAQNSP